MRDETTAQGAKFSFAIGCRIGAALIKRGGYELPETRLIERILEPGAIFIDVGAHIGYHAVLAARRVAPDGLVVAFEPDPRSYAFLIINLTQNQDARCAVAFNLAILDRSGPAELHLSASNPADNRCYDARDGRPRIPIGALTLDAILGTLLGPRNLKPRLIKIDTQGSELEVLRGAAWSLESRPDLLVEWWPKGLGLAGHEPKELLDHLEGLGYELLLVGNGPASRRALLEVARSKPMAHLNLHCRRKTK